MLMTQDDDLSHSFGGLVPPWVFWSSKAAPSASPMSKTLRDA